MDLSNRNLQCLVFLYVDEIVELFSIVLSLGPVWRDLHQLLVLGLKDEALLGELVEAGAGRAEVVDNVDVLGHERGVV